MVVCTLLPLFVLPLLSIITCFSIESDVSALFMASLFGYTMIKSAMGTCGLCFQQQTCAKKYLIAVQAVFFVLDVSLLPYMILQSVYIPPIIVMVYILLAVISYIPLNVQLCHKRSAARWQDCFRYRHPNGKAVGCVFPILSLIWLVFVMVAFGFMLQIVAICMTQWATLGLFMTWMLCWMATYASTVHTIAVCIPFCHKFQTTYEKQRPLIWYEDVANNEPHEVIHGHGEVYDSGMVCNKYWMYGTFATTFLVSFAMCCIQFAALNVSAPPLNLINQTCFNQNVTNDDLQVLATTSLSNLVFALPCLVLGVLNGFYMFVN